MSMENSKKELEELEKKKGPVTTPVKIDDRHHTISEVSADRSREFNNMEEPKPIQDEMKDADESASNELEQGLKYLQASDDAMESKVGKKLSDSTQKAVITLVLTMLLSSAFL